MLRDGEYSAWFRTRLGQGTGKVRFENGQMSGGDSIISYSGSYEVDGSYFTIVLTTRRHAAGQPSLLGVDNVQLKLTGVSNGRIATCSGTLDPVSDMAVEVTLIRVEKDLTPAAQHAPDQPIVYHPERLPEPPSSRSIKRSGSR